jgi:hypothetical protein
MGRWEESMRRGLNWNLKQGGWQGPDIPCISLQLANKKVAYIFHHSDTVFEAFRTSVKEVLVILRFICVRIVEDMKVN